MRWSLTKGSGFLFPECFRRRGERGRGADGSADDHQSPGPFAGGHDALLSSGRGGEP